MVGGLVPTATVPVNAGLRECADERIRYPDVIQPAASIRSRPVARPVTPPSVEALVPRQEMPDRVDKSARLLQEPEAFDLDRGVADDRQELFVRPDISLQWGNVQIAHRNHGPAVLPFCGEPCRQLVEEPQLMGKFRVGLRVWHVATCRHINVVKLDAAGQFDRSMSSIGAGAPGADVRRSKWDPGEDCDAVVALHPVHQHLAVAKRLECFAWEETVRRLSLL